MSTRLGRLFKLHIIELEGSIVVCCCSSPPKRVRRRRQRTHCRAQLHSLRTLPSGNLLVCGFLQQKPVLVRSVGDEQQVLSNLFLGLFGSAK
jgi:hypothetical protein